MSPIAFEMRTGSPLLMTSSRYLAIALGLSRYSQQGRRSQTFGFPVPRSFPLNVTARLTARIEAARPAPRVFVMRDAGADRDRAGLHVAVIDVPALLAGVSRSAAGKSGHAPEVTRFLPAIHTQNVGNGITHPLRWRAIRATLRSPCEFVVVWGRIHEKAEHVPLDRRPGFLRVP
jgi:hypothetical protein